MKLFDKQIIKRKLCKLGYTFALLLMMFVICQSESIGERKSDDELRVLFIGNSLTYFNDLPSIIKALAENNGQKKLNYKTIAFPDFSLEDHWDKDDAIKEIKKGSWQIVVLQQGPSASVEGRKLLLEYTKRFSEEIRLVGAKTALYSVWPSINRIQDFERASESYKMAAKQSDSLFFPVADAWQAAWRRDSKLELYASDGLHPTLTGSYLAALVIYEQLYEQTPAILTSEVKLSKLKLSAEQIKSIHAAAIEVNQKLKDKK